MRTDLRAKVTQAVATGARVRQATARLLEAVRTQVRNLVQKQHDWDLDPTTFDHEASGASTAPSKLIAVISQVSGEGLFGAKTAYDQLHQVTAALADITASIRPLMDVSAETTRAASGAITQRIEHWRETFAKDFQKDVAQEVEHRRRDFYERGVMSPQERNALILSSGYPLH